MGHGRSIQSIWEEKYGKDEADRRQQLSILRLKASQAAWDEETKKRVYKHNVGKPSPIRGKKLLDVYIAKYGEGEGQKRFANMIAKHPKFGKGEDNPQWGKPANQGSGNGWSGWYRGWYFRSLLELSFMINYIEAQDIHFVTAETKQYRIPYMLNGVARNYFADFVLEDSILAEVKPLSLLSSAIVMSKAKAATEWCNSHRLSYRIFTEKDFDILSSDQLKELRAAGYIKFIHRYEEKYKQKYE